MIVPDVKDWTWIIERACPECGFDARACAPEAVAGLVSENVQQWEQLLAQGAIVAGRPDDATWSTLEYAAHVRDVYRTCDGRIARMLSEDDPTFANWDQDASAEEDAYETQEPAVVVGEMRVAAATVSERLSAVTEGDWSRPGQRSDGASFTVSTLARYMLHDTVHHIWDVTRDGEAST